MLLIQYQRRFAHRLFRKHRSISKETNRMIKSSRLRPIIPYLVEDLLRHSDTAIFEGAVNKGFEDLRVVGYSAFDRRSGIFGES